MRQLKLNIDASEGLERWRKQIDKALWSGGNLQDYYDVEDKLDKGYLYLFENADAFIIAEPQEWPKGRVIHVLIAGGTVPGFKALLPIVTHAAREAGAIKMTGIVRKGLKDLIPTVGWKMTQYYIEREL